MLPFGDSEIAANEAVRAASAMAHAHMHHIGGTTYDVQRDDDAGGEDADGSTGPMPDNEIAGQVTGYVVQETAQTTGRPQAGAPVVLGDLVFLGTAEQDVRAGDVLIDVADRTRRYRVETADTTNITRARLKTPA